MNGIGALTNLAVPIAARPSNLASDDSELFWRQERFFALLNLLLIGALLTLQEISRLVRGRPAASVVIVLAVGFAIQVLYFGWLRMNPTPLSLPTRRIVTFWSLGFNSALSLLLTCLTIRGDTAYYALMLLPILEAAFNLGLDLTVSVILLADFICFLGAYGMKFGEYIEAGAMSVIYMVMGLLVWLLVNNLREREASVVRNLRELERTREQLLSEEKLAAVGRLSRAIAHEIRNPVAMISSSLATALRPGQAQTEQREMFGIAAKEAARLERFTADLLSYARPQTVQVTHANLSDLINYVATLARAHAADKGVSIDVATEGNLEGEFDAGRIQQAVLNLVLNAIDACRRGDSVKLRAHMDGDARIRIYVVDPAGPISQEVAPRIFEPLFTTKQGGNGLGLAIARNIARAHGGDIMLRLNQPGRVCFSIEIPARPDKSAVSREF